MTDRIEADDAEARLIKSGFECHRAANHVWLYATDPIGTNRLKIINGTVEAAHVIAILAGKGFDADGNRPPLKTYGVQNVEVLIDIFEARRNVADRAQATAKTAGLREGYRATAEAFRVAAEIIRNTEFIGWKQS